MHIEENRKKFPDRIDFIHYVIYNAIGSVRKMGIAQLTTMNGVACSCGKTHAFHTQLVIGKDALRQLPDLIKSLGSKPFLLSDRNTQAAAGNRVVSILKTAGISFGSYCFPGPHVEPDEVAVGAAVMHFDCSCDLIVGIGSGVINDIGKILSYLTGKPYIIVGTAPSMDGYASASSSMTRDGLKISLPTRSADVILGDTDILCAAPLHMMKAGLGDMLAKYISICEWRISHLITGEYYCEDIARLIRDALQCCIDHAPGLLQRDEAAVQAVFEGLVIGGIAMNYAGLSRPASGVEHYISHLLDMRAVEFGTPAELHGIQCGVGTRIALQMYERMRTVQPDRQKALAYAAAFDREAWKQQLRSLLGKGAESMIELEEKEQKYDLRQHQERLAVITEHWQEILQIMDEELPSLRELEQLLDAMGMPKSLSGIGIEPALLKQLFPATKDIRDKYVLSRLAWDLGVLDEIIEN